MNYRLFVKGLFNQMVALNIKNIRKEYRVSCATKFLSTHFYLTEVQLEEKKTCKFNKYLGLYDQYMLQIIRNGNCITLLSNSTALTDKSFWNANYFEDLTKYVFWTFNTSFLLKLIEEIPCLKLSILTHCLELLQQNPKPYKELLDGSQDEELIWCHFKNQRLKTDSRFNMIYSLDRHNRTVVLQSLFVAAKVDLSASLSVTST